jgi:hypothetical protein
LVPKILTDYGWRTKLQLRPEIFFTTGRANKDVRGQTKANSSLFPLLFPLSFIFFVSHAGDSIDTG